MSRLIDADALYKFIQDQMEKETGAYTRGKNKAFNIVKSALHNECATPTIDAVAVTRCRECKHCDPENHHCDHHMGTAAPLRRDPDDFCSYGEKKEGAD